jgi:mRNA interferase MazF
MPGNVFVPAIASGLPKDSVVNVTALVGICQIK